MLQIGERTAARLMASGDLRAMRIRGKLWRTTRQMVREYLWKGMDFSGKGANIREISPELRATRAAVMRL